LGTLDAQLITFQSNCLKPLHFEGLRVECDTDAV